MHPVCSLPVPPEVELPSEHLQAIMTAVSHIVPHFGSLFLCLEQGWKFDFQHDFHLGIAIIRQE